MVHREFKNRSTDVYSKEIEIVNDKEKVTIEIVKKN